MRLEHEFTVPVPVEEAWPVLLDIERIAPCMPGAKLDTVDGDDFTGSVKVKLGPINLTYKGAAKFTSKDDASHTAVIDARGRDSRGNGTAAAVITANLVGAGSETTVKVATDLNITGKPAQFGRGVMVDVGNKLIGQFADCLAGKLGQSDADYLAEQQATEQQTAEPKVAQPKVAEPKIGQQADSAAAAPAESAPAADGSGDPDAGVQKSAQDSASGAAAASVTDGATAPSEPGTLPASAAHSAPDLAPSAVAKPAPRKIAEQPEPEPIDLLELAGGSVAKRAVPAAVVFVLLALLFVVLRRRRG